MLLSAVAINGVNGSRRVTQDMRTHANVGIRPGLVFIALLALLLGVYVLLVDILGALVTYLVQALIVIALIVVMRRITNGRNPRP